MNRLYLILLWLFAFLVPLAGQEPLFEERAMPKDSLPDLWIVTIDMSKSMLSCRDGLSLVPEKTKSMILCNNSAKGRTDTYVLQLSGSDKNQLLVKNRDSKTYEDKSLVSDLIHKTTVFGNLDELITRLKQNVGSSALFEYDMSFTSLVRPLSVYELTLGENIDFCNYRKIYHVLITDDGDINDQWMQDYKWMRKWCPKNFSRYNEILTAVACSEFDFTSRKAGKFIELQSNTVQPRIYLTEYVTYQNDNPVNHLQTESLVTVSDFHDNRITLKMKPCGDSVNFVYVDTCRVNGHAVPVNRYVYLGDTIIVQYDKNFAKTFQNVVTIEGSYQEIYKDRILGLRYRKVPYGGELFGFFVPEETKAVERQCLRAVALLLLAILIFVRRWRECVVLKIYVNGKCMRIRRKAMNKLKNEDFFLVTVLCDNYGMPDALFYNGKGISVEDDNQTEKWGHTLKIRSFHELSIDSSMFRPNKKDGFDKIDFDPDVILKNSDEQPIKAQFSYANRLSHNLIISFEKKRDFEMKSEENKLRDCNIEMLARYYEERALEINNLRNNVQVNIIRKGTFNDILGDDYKLDYAILNIYDLNCRNRANHIFLRCSIVCNFDGNQSDAYVTKELLQVAKEKILKSEKQELGFFDMVAYREKPEDETGVEVDVSPMLTYLYLLKEGKEGKKVKRRKCRLVYSPFVDGRPPFLDGRPGLPNKTVKIYPNSVMTLLNLPFKYQNPAANKNLGDKETFNPRRKKTETLYFKGADKIGFLDDKEHNYSKGRLEGGVTNTWSLDSLVF